MVDLFTKYMAVLSLSAHELGNCTLSPLLRECTAPIGRQIYGVSTRAPEVINKCVGNMENGGIAEKGSSVWGPPICIVAKSDGFSRFCVDYRISLNKSLLRETWSVPNAEEHIDTVGGAKFIAVCDVQSEYWQIPMAEKDSDKTVFVTHKGKYKFKASFLGIANAPWAFQHVI